jgi:hypothetical protein
MKPFASFGVYCPFVLMHVRGHGWLAPTPCRITFMICPHARSLMQVVIQAQQAQTSRPMRAATTL